MPALVSSCARIEPVQPSPTITTSVDGSVRVMTGIPRCGGASMRDPIGPAGDADRRQREALVVAVDPVAIVVAGAGKAHHLPADHVAIAAIDRIGEEALARVVQQLLEESFRAGAVELGRALLEAAEHLILLLVGQLRERLAGE